MRGEHAYRKEERQVQGRSIMQRIPVMHLANLLLALVMSVVVLDKHLPPLVERASVSETVQHKVKIRSRTKHRPMDTYWVVVKLDNGRKFQTERVAKVFPVGTELELRVGALLSGVQAYRMDRDTHPWVALETENEDFKPMPYAVIVFSILLLLPWWSVETRWVMQIIQITVLVAWMFMLFGTGILVRLS